MALLLFFRQSFKRRTILIMNHITVFSTERYCKQSDNLATYVRPYRAEKKQLLPSLSLKKNHYPYKNSEECPPSLMRPRLAVTYRPRSFGEMEIAMPQTLLVESG